MIKSAFILLLLTVAISPFQYSNHRKVLLFSTNKASSLLLQQQKMLSADSKGIRERDITIEIYIHTGQHSAVFKKYNAQNQPFVFILIGKDGGEKLRSTTPVTNEKLFDLIDQMPMRQSEMRRQ